MRRALWSALIIASAVTAIVLFATGLPLLGEIPTWFYRPVDKGLTAATYGAAALALVPVLLALSFWGVGRGAHRRALLALIGVVYLAQTGLTAIAGTEELYERLSTGHSQFLAVAEARRGQLLDTLWNYERLATDQELTIFGRTKPPGTYLAYATLVELGHFAPIRAALSPLAAAARRDERLESYPEAAAAAIVLMPLATALVVLPLWWLGLALLDDREESFAAVALYASAPAVLLITYHLDGSWFPLFGVGGAAALATGLRRARPGWTLLGGLLLGYGLFCSFSLIPVLGLAAGGALAVTLDRIRKGAPRRAELERFVGHLALLAIAALLMLSLLKLVLGFDLATRYQTAMWVHYWWKGPHHILLQRITGVVEFALYASLPLFFAFLARAGAALGRLARRRFDARDILSVGLLVSFVALGVEVGSNEAARMWLFLIPFFAIVVASGLRAVGPADGDRGGLLRPLGWLVAAQLVVALVMKGYQPW